MARTRPRDATRTRDQLEALVAVAVMSADSIEERAARGAVAFEDPIEAPVAYAPRPQTLVVVDRRERETGAPLHVVGVGILLATAIGMFTVLDGSAMRNLGVVLGIVAAIATGYLMVRKGRPASRFEEVPLLWLHTGLRLLRVRQSPESERLSDAPNIAFDEVREVLFAVRKFTPRGSDAPIDGAAVFIRMVDGAVWPVIPGTLEKEAAYKIAVGVGTRVGVRVKQVGQGWASDSTGD